MSSANPDTVTSANRAVTSRSRRDEEDAATVIAILTALAANGGGAEEVPAARSVWADPAHRFGLLSVSATGWWASGLAR